MVASEDFAELRGEVRQLREALEEVQNQLLMHRQVLEECLELRDGMACVMGASKVLNEVGDRFAELELSLAGVSENTASQGQAITALTEKQKRSSVTIDAVVRAIKRLDRRGLMNRNGPLLSARGGESVHSANGPPRTGTYGSEFEAGRSEFGDPDCGSADYEEPFMGPRGHDARGYVTTASSCDSDGGFGRAMRPPSRRGYSHDARTPHHSSRDAYHSSRDGGRYTGSQLPDNFVERADPRGDWISGGPGSNNHVYDYQPRTARGASTSRGDSRSHHLRTAAPPAEHGRCAKAVFEVIDDALAKLDSARNGRSPPTSKELAALAAELKQPITARHTGNAVAGGHAKSATAGRRRGVASDQPSASPIEATTEPEGEEYG